MSQTTTGFHLGARAGFQVSRRGLPSWFLIGLVLLFLPTIWVHEAVFWVVGRLACRCGWCRCGLFVAWASSFWRWDWLSTIAGLIAAHFLIGGVAAYPSTTFYGLPTPRTLQLLVLQVVYAWKDLLTITPPLGLRRSSNGSLAERPALLLHLRAIGPSCWACNCCGYSRSRYGSYRYCLGQGRYLPEYLAHCRMVGTCLGLVCMGRSVPSTRGRIGCSSRWGSRIGYLSDAGETTQGGSQGSIHLGRQIAGGALVIAVVAAAAIPLTNAYGPWYTRVVLRDVVQPPLDARQYPSPLSAFRHYNVDLQEQNLDPRGWSSRRRTRAYRCHG